MIGDEALYIFETGYRATRLVDTVPWASADAEEIAAEIIRRECGGKPILIVNDMTDQHFKGGQRMPKVGPLDRANVVALKLNVAFPNYSIRGALPIKEAAPRSAKGKTEPPQKKPSGGLYLFAGVPMSDPVKKTLDVVRRSMAPVSGFVLLPVESSGLVGALAEKVMKREKTKSRWAVILGQHMGGGLRQVVIRDGQLAMTRMTPVASLEADPDAWVEEVSQEFKATISYLSRFGYAPEDGIEVFVIATPSAGQALQSRIDVACNFTSYTVTEAAGVVGIQLGPQDDQYHADALHAAWIGRKTRFVLPMQAVDVKKIHAPRQAAMLAMLLLIGGGGYMGWQLMSQSQSLIEAQHTLQAQRRAQVDIESQYAAELARMEALGFDVRLIQGALRSFAELEKGGVHPLPLVQGIGRALGTDVRLDKIVVTTNTAQAQTSPARAQASGSDISKGGNFTATLTLSFPATIEPEVGVRQVGDLGRRLAAELPSEYSVEVVKQVADLSYTDNTVGEVGQSGPNARPRDDYRAEIAIKGPLL